MLMTMPMVIMGLVFVALAALSVRWWRHRR